MWPCMHKEQGKTECLLDIKNTQGSHNNSSKFQCTQIAKNIVVTSTGLNHHIYQIPLYISIHSSQQNWKIIQKIKETEDHRLLTMQNLKAQSTLKLHLEPHAKRTLARAWKSKSDHTHVSANKQTNKMTKNINIPNFFRCMIWLELQKIQSNVALVQLVEGINDDKVHLYCRLNLLQKS